MIFGQNNPPSSPKYAHSPADKNLIPIKTAVLEKFTTLRNTLKYLIIGLIITFAVYAFPNIYVVSAGLLFFITTIFLTKKELSRLEQKYLK